MPVSSPGLADPKNSEGLASLLSQRPEEAEGEEA